VVFAAFSIEAKIKGTPPLSTAQAFTSLSILALLTSPAMMLLQSLPQVAAATGCIKRVQNFLLAKGFHDQRSFSGARQVDSSDSTAPDSVEEKMMLSNDSAGYILSVKELVVRPSPDSTDAENPITFKAKRGTVTMILGPVGSGKSTLLKAILGELSPKSGTIDVSTPYIGYCSQAPWLQNCTVRDNIIGVNAFDRDWYQSIIHACALEEDLSNMPLKDSTIIGSRGITLSGGQKHRVVSLSRL
jgi:ABC-type bacteriocin/lantibiotic exporter with double-glycine peptidase domain